MTTRPAIHSRGDRRHLDLLALAALVVCAAFGLPAEAAAGSEAAPAADAAESHADRADRGVTLHALLEKTIFRIDIVALELWLGPGAVRRAAPVLSSFAADDALPSAARDDLARAVARSRDARAVLTFQRDVDFERLLAGATGDLRRARDAGLLSPAGYDEVAAGLPRWLAPLQAEGLRAGDRFVQTVTGDTLRTVVERHGGEVVVDQTDVGPEHRHALLGSYLAPGSGLRDQLLDGLVAALRARAQDSAE